tara:strand:+ start:187 stop:384 length:198 start_codon:yes stop_codon:yes gene_type:complete
MTTTMPMRVTMEISVIDNEDTGLDFLGLNENSLSVCNKLRDVVDAADIGKYQFIAEISEIKLNRS